MYNQNLKELSFYDWVLRLNAVLSESFKEIEDSTVEDSLENVVRIFKKKSNKVTKLVKGIKLNIDETGLFFVNQFTGRNIYIIILDRNGDITEFPLDDSYAMVGVTDFIHARITGDYSTTMAKLLDKEERLRVELNEIKQDLEKIRLLQKKVNTAAKTVDKKDE